MGKSCEECKWWKRINGPFGRCESPMFDSTNLCEKAKDRFPTTLQDWKCADFEERKPDERQQ